MRIKDGFVVEKVGGKYLAVAIGERADEFNALIRMNESGVFLWNTLSAESLTADELVEKLLSEYDVDRDRAETDVYAFVAKLRESGLLDE